MCYLKGQNPRVIILVGFDQMLYRPCNIGTHRCQNYHAYQRYHNSTACDSFGILNLVKFFWHRKPWPKLTLVIKYEKIKVNSIARQNQQLFIDKPK